MPSLTTDNAKNIINTGQLAGFQPHIGCIAHTINLATQQGLKVPQLDRLLGRIQRVVTYFHKSYIAMAILNTKQTLLELPHHKLIMDVSTRWNSTFDMLECFLEQQPAIEATLLSKDLKKNFKDVYTMSEDDISTASRVMEVLKPIKKVTTILCSEKSPTVSLIHPLKEMMLQQLRDIQDDDGNVVTAAKEAMIKELEQSYSDHTMKLFLHESSCIDPS
ncbi:E3 SUMO-protein ligase ZBED1-like [Argopecten irradians]|uniref:E3 SUMO-protein ligase ZBED1-like n=1 Tax=Argopecten irradians TaxID=31199 RepID=UPI0037154615